MGDSAVFERTCKELESLTDFDRLEVRGTVRLGLKAAGLSGGSVDQTQMCIMLRRVLPGELVARGMSDPAGTCEKVALMIEKLEFEGTSDRISAAAATIGRFGS